MRAAQDLSPEQEESLLRLFTSDVVASIKARKLEQAQVGPACFSVRWCPFLGMKSHHALPLKSHVFSSEAAHLTHWASCSRKLVDQACCSAGAPRAINTLSWLSKLPVRKAQQQGIVYRSQDPQAMTPTV